MNYSEIGPGGYPSNIDNQIAHGYKYVESLPYGALIGKVGYGSIIAIGNQSGPFYAENDGFLFLRINDSDISLGDNYGDIIVYLGQAKSTQPKASATKLDNAVAWAWSQIGSTDWGTGDNTFCEQFVENAFGTTGKFLTAYNAYQSIGISGNPQVPGQIVFFAPTNDNLSGHSGIYVGNDQFISVTSSGVQLKSLSQWNENVAIYLGYADPPSSWPGQ